MTVSFASVPVFADPDALESQADDIAAAGTEANTIGVNCHSTWSGLAAVYTAPEAEQAVRAFDKVKAYGDEALTVSGLIKAALTTFAGQVRGFKTRHDALVLAAGACTPDGEEQTDEEAAAERELQGKVNQLVREYEEAEAQCISAIGGATGQISTPGWADGLGTSTTVADTIREHIHQSPIHVRKPLEVVTSPTVFDLELGPPLRLEGPLHMDDMPYDYIDGNGNKFVKTASGILAPVGSAVDVNRPPIDPDAYERPGPTLRLDPDAVVPPDWARNAGRGLFVVDAGLTVWEQGSSQYNEDLASHPDWDSGQRAASVTENVVIVGGMSLAGGAAGAWAGAKGGALLGGAIGSIFPGPGTAIGGVVGGIVGGLAGGIVGSGLGEKVGEGIKSAWNSLWD